MQIHSMWTIKNKKSHHQPTNGSKHMKQTPKSDLEMIALINKLQDTSQCS